MQSITSPEYHIYKWGGSRELGLLIAKKILGAFSVTSRRWISTSRRSNVTTFKRRDANLTLLWNVATCDSNVATWILNLSGTSRREIRTSRRGF